MCAPGPGQTGRTHLAQSPATRPQAGPGGRVCRGEASHCFQPQDPPGPDLLPGWCDGRGIGLGGRLAGGGVPVGAAGGAPQARARPGAGCRVRGGCASPSQGPAGCGRVGPPTPPPLWPPLDAPGPLQVTTMMAFAGCSSLSCSPPPALRSRPRKHATVSAQPARRRAGTKRRHGPAGGIDVAACDSEEALMFWNEQPVLRVRGRWSSGRRVAPAFIDSDAPGEGFRSESSALLQVLQA
jgi:hypothetical protein